MVGPRAVRLLPLFAPAAALYAKPLLATLREDFALIPGLLEMDAPEQPVAAPPVVDEPEPPIEGQLGLF